MDPIAQIFAQSQAGSAGGEGFGQFFAEGVRQSQQQQGLNFSRRRLELEEERERRAEPMMELERMQALQRLAIGSLTLQKTESDNNYAISLRNADLEISKFMSALAQSGKWGSPESWQAWNQITSRVPLAAVSKSGQLFLQQQQLAMASQRLAEQFGGRPTQVTVPTPEGGQALFGQSRQAIPDKLEIATEMSRLQSIIESTTGKEREAAIKQLENIQSQMGASSTEIFDPATGQPIMRTTTGRQPSSASAGGATTATVNRAQQNLSDTQKAISELSDLERTLRPKDVGISGVWGETVLDRVLPQFGFGRGDIERMDNRTKLKSIAQSLLREVSADNRFTENDRRAIEAIVPKSGVVESYENAIRSSRTLRRIFAKRALIESQTIAQPPPLWALESLDNIGLSESARSGLITKDQALAEFDRREALKKP